jgi:cob(I)alamin adenosyltransferase
LSHHTDIEPLLITYMNRLSDFLFVAARLENSRQSRPEIPW